MPIPDVDTKEKLTILALYQTLIDLLHRINKIAINIAQRFQEFKSFMKMAKIISYSKWIVFLKSKMILESDMRE